MKIHYKFNKSSEARDCIAESVELEVPKEVKETVHKRLTSNLNLESLLASLKITKKILSDHVYNLTLDLTSLGKSRTCYNHIKQTYEVIINEKYVIWVPVKELEESYYDRDTQRSYYTVKFTISLIKGVGGEPFNNTIYGKKLYTFEVSHITKYANDATYFHFDEVKEYKDKQLTEVRKNVNVVEIFKSSEDLKNYISTLTDKIKFIAKSDLDQVLLKEWLCDWEYKPFTLDLIDEDSEDLNNSLQYKNVTKTFPIEEFRTQLLIDRGDEEWFTLDRVNNITIKDLTTKDLDDSTAQSLNSSIEVTLREGYDGYKSIAEYGKIGWMFSLLDKVYFVGYCYKNDRQDCIEVKGKVNKNNIYEVTSTFYKNKYILNSNWKFIIN